MKARASDPAAGQPGAPCRARALGKGGATPGLTVTRGGSQLRLPVGRGCALRQPLLLSITGAPSVRRAAADSEPAHRPATAGRPPQPPGARRLARGAVARTRRGRRDRRRARPTTAPGDEPRLVPRRRRRGQSRLIATPTARVWVARGAEASRSRDGRRGMRADRRPGRCRAPTRGDIYVAHVRLPRPGHVLAARRARRRARSRSRRSAISSSGAEPRRRPSATARSRRDDADARGRPAATSKI